jgi:hypothetical protein
MATLQDHMTLNTPMVSTTVSAYVRINSKDAITE